MKIALLGYGKMGRAIEQLALESGHEVLLRIDLQNLDERRPEKLSQVDVAIEFSRPDSAFANLEACLQAGIPVVCGTTGWLDRLDELKSICRERNGAVLYASNFSIGVNIFFALNRYLAKLMGPQEQYEVKLEEIHHTQKLDAPSGTAITLAEGILEEMSRKKKWVNEPAVSPEELPISSRRIGLIPGTHSVTYTSGVDRIEIIHEAHSREGFARGALLAAEWIQGRQGFFSMGDVLGI